MSLTSNRSGKVKVSTLLVLLLIAAGGYYGFAYGSVYWRRYQVVGAVEEQLSYAGQIVDEAIREQIVKKIQQMDLPPAASRVGLARTGARTIQISISYTETVNLLYTKKNVPVTVKESRRY